jgi:hypothetical protein
MGIEKLKRWLSVEFTIVTPWRVGRVLALGALLAAGTTLYFNMAPEGESSRPSSGEKMEVAPNSTVDRTLSNIELERMDYEADLMLWKAAVKPSADSPRSTGRALHDRALVDQLAEANEKAYDELSKSFIGIPYLGQRNEVVGPLWNLRSIERLEEKISIIVQNAAQASKPLSNKEIERLYTQIDLMLAAKELDRSGYSPSSSEQIGTWPPDTEYYRNPDYREYEVTK